MEISRGKQIAGAVALVALVAVGALAALKGRERAEPPARAPMHAYANAEFHYSFSYPEGWVMEPEKSIVDLMNKMPSLVTVHEPGEGAVRRFSVTINYHERLIKNAAPKKMPVTIGGIEATAYLFPDGYECTPTTEDKDCSFFLIPVLRDGVWYEITAANDAQTLDAYRPLLESFAFSK